MDELDFRDEIRAIQLLRRPDKVTQAEIRISS